MRLLNTRTLELREFIGCEIPEYAILSHRWGPDEVSMDDYLAGRKKESHGYQKILKLCEVARTGIDIDYTPIYSVSGESFNWAWIDTCCIDKRSSSELSEAINSMYRWYQKAAVCFVFLPDVHRVPEGQTVESTAITNAGKGWAPFLQEEFIGSEWFTRGWTLQELVAPLHVMFMNTDFEFLGWKRTSNIASLIAGITNINQPVLQTRMFDMFDCVAQRISWISSRKTTREEDMAYCLLGLCNVNMPLLYGEGLVRAFYRLQLEIIATSGDDSIFAWGNSNHPASGLLAQSPAWFSNCHDLMRYPTHLSKGVTFFSGTQQGIRFDYRLPKGLRPHANDCWSLLLPLQCGSYTEDGKGSPTRCYVNLEVRQTTLFRSYDDDSYTAIRSRVVRHDEATQKAILRRVQFHSDPEVPETRSLSEIQLQDLLRPREIGSWTRHQVLRSLNKVLRGPKIVRIYVENWHGGDRSLKNYEQS